MSTETKGNSQCCATHIIGMRNVRNKAQGKLKIVNQEIEYLILGVS